MTPFQDVSRLFKGVDRPITTIDSHTEGESTRLIVDGVGEIPGNTMMEKLDYFKTHYDQVRCLLTKEPRGSREVLAAMVKNITLSADESLIRRAREKAAREQRSLNRALRMKIYIMQK